MELARSELLITIPLEIIGEIMSYAADSRGMYLTCKDLYAIAPTTHKLYWTSTDPEIKCINHPPGIDSVILILDLIKYNNIPAFKGKVRSYLEQRSAPPNRMVINHIAPFSNIHHLLIHACKYCEISIVEYLISMGAQVSYIRYTPFKSAVSSQRVETVKYLLEKCEIPTSAVKLLLAGGYGATTVEPILTNHLKNAR